VEARVTTSKVVLTGPRLWAIMVPTGVIAVAAAVGYLVAGGLGGGRAGSCQQLYLNGRTAFQAGGFQAAVRDWQGAVQSNPTSFRSRRARQLAAKFLPLARAAVAIEQDRWDAARHHLADARAVGLGKEQIDPIMRALVRGEQIEGLERQFEQLIELRQWDQGASVLKRLAGLDPDGQGARQALLVSVRRRVRSKQLRQSARQCMAGADYRGAVKALQQVVQLEPSPDAQMELRKALTQQAVVELVAAADRADDQQDYTGATVLLVQALGLGGGGNLEGRLARTRARALLQRAEQLEQAGQLAVAAEVLAESLEQHELKGAREALEQVNNLLRRRAVLDQANRPLAERRWEEALDAYEQVVAIEPEEFAESRAKLCRYHLALIRGDQLLADERWEEAFAAYQDAKLLGDARVGQERIDRLLRVRDRHRKLSEADAYLQAGHFEAAYKLLKQVDQVRPCQEVRDRLSELGYQRYLAAARAALAAGNRTLAIDHANSARRHRSGAELELLFSKLRQSQTSRPAR